jgi:hypothetical protein
MDQAPNDHAALFNEYDEAALQHSRLVAGVLKFLYTDDQLREMWVKFWKVPTEQGVGKSSLSEIIEEDLEVPSSQFAAALPEQKAEWCLQVRNHPEMGSLYGYAFRHLYPSECSKADGLLMQNRSWEFGEFARAAGMESKRALFYLVAAGFGFLLIGKERHRFLLSQALNANGIHDSQRN